MKRMFYIIFIIIFISCGKEKVKTETPESEQVTQDTISISDFGEHKSIHQQEWEEHQKDIKTDTLIVE